LKLLTANSSSEFSLRYLVWTWAEILERPLEFVHDRRVTSTDVLLHPAPSFATHAHPALLFHFMLLQCYTLSCFTVGSLQFSDVTSARCDTPLVTHHRIMPRYPTINLFL
jgi:hypothetical protein